MTRTSNAPLTPLEVARSRHEEAGRVTDAWRHVATRHRYTAWEKTGKDGELQAWADVARAEAQVSAAEARERRAWEEVAQLGKEAQEARTLARLKATRGRASGR